MTDFIFPPSNPVHIPIRGMTATFPVRRLYCIGRNYAEHAIEMGHDPNREPPFFFQKNPDNILLDDKFPYPSKSQDVHHEVELVVALQAGGENLSVEQAQEAIFGYAIGLDMTRRDLQATAKKMGRPWEIGKAFEASAPMSPITPRDGKTILQDGQISLHVNGELRQNGNLNQMIWKIPEMIVYLSEHFCLAPGDLIMTGTPAGVAAVTSGDRLEASIETLGTHVLTVL